MFNPGLRLPLMTVSLLLLASGRACALGEILGQTKEELKLNYEISVYDHGTGRVTATLTIADEGRLAPLDSVELCIPAKEKKKDGGQFMDLVVSLDMQKSDDGKRTARIHLNKELAERAQIWLTTSTFDGKRQPLTRFHHVIPIANYLQISKQAAAKADAAAPATAAPPATERKKD
jgi:hypothetical protein